MIGKHYKYTAIFCTEALKNIQALEDLLARLKQGHDPILINAVFRATHTLKGNAFGMGFSHIASLSDSLEKFFDVVRKQKVAISADAFEILTSSTNELRTMVLSITDPAVKNGNVTLIKNQLGSITQLLKEQTGHENHYPEVEPRPFDPEPVHGKNSDWHSEKESNPPVEEDTPIGNKISLVCLVRKLQDVVRFTAQAIEKEAFLEFEGAETQIDFSILPVVDRVLLQLLRNAVAHGIEDVPHRMAAGKTYPGKVSICASISDDVVIIEVRDDGRGLHYNRIRQLALSLGMITTDSADTISEEQLSQFIFEPGFSTAESVTFVAGRGTGMDIVKTEVESIGGSITVTSIPGVGTSFFLMLPATYEQ